MFTRIVVGIDFSARSLAAARWAAQQLAPEARVNFVHVLPEPVEPSFMQRRLTEIRALMSEVAPALEGGLKNLGALLAPGRSTVTVRRGEVADELARAAEEDEAEVVCLGRRRSRRGGARFGATTAHRLLTRCSTAVLIIPVTNDVAPSRILVALDDHDGRVALLRTAMHAARTWNADVHALHVLSPALRDFVRSARPTEPVPGNGAGAREHVERISDEQALFGVTREWLTEQLDTVRPHGIRTRAHVGVGDPGQEIVADAHSSRADLIVIGRASAPPDADVPTRPFPLGSTTRLVTWAAPCPVLVVPAMPVPATAPRPKRFTYAQRGLASVGAT
ncbi:MAG: universal stress protein [bacterium]